MSKSSFKDVDHGWKHIKEELKKMKGAYVKVGVLEDAGEEKRESTKGGSTSVKIVDVATFNEFGTSRIPPRPFMAQSFDLNREGVLQFVDRLKAKILKGSTVKASLEELGVFFTGKVKEQIAKGEFAPNAPTTIKIKGSDHPLIDKGQLKNSIAHKVVMGEK